jgi:hypothetical protein
MNPRELAQKMLQWEVMQIAADKLAAEIEAAVLELGKTQTVGNVRASYSKGRTAYDYETPAQAAEKAGSLPDGAIEANTKTVINWRGVCADADIDPVMAGVRRPSVKLKFV